MRSKERKLKFLLVGHDSNTVLIYKDLLEAQSHTVNIATYANALTKIEELHPDVILCDEDKILLNATHLLEDIRKKFVDKEFDIILITDHSIEKESRQLSNELIFSPVLAMFPAPPRIQSRIFYQ